MIRGVDGCRAGWLCAAVDSETGKVAGQVYPDAISLLGDASAMVTAIDIPIALPSTGPRQCDLDARRLLGPRSSSVFPAPMRASLQADSYDAACAVNLERSGKKLSKQTYALLPKIREVNAAVRNSQALARAVWEIHPEVSFYFWNSRRPMTRHKSSGFGFLERYELVQAAFGDDVPREMRDALSRDAVADDDILDALAALWSARRIHAGTAISVPQTAQHDEDGLPMRILA